jgi:hypothetical protein
MEHDDILHLEAMHILTEASSDMLSLVDLEELDLNALARMELRSRRQPIVSAMVREFTGF